VWAANTASAARDFGAGLPYAARAVDLARNQGLLSLLPMALHRYAQELLWNSEFDAAYVAAQEGYQLSVDLGYGSGGHLANLAAVEALWGSEADAREHAEQALAIGRQTNFNLLADSAEFTLAFIELAGGRVDPATDRLLWLTAPDRPDANQIIVLGAVPDLVEAAVRAGRADAVVAERVAAYRAWVGFTATDSGKALLARSEALLGERPADEAFAEAIELAPALPPLQRARTELLYGEWLRRQPRRQEARARLRAALELFRSLRAIPWERRAEAELRATGETTRKRDPSTLDELTPQELQIAGLVADGLTNRDIAAQLYLSPRTIDYHLRKVFTKLGIASRTQLVQHQALLRRPD
jgi:DNA-binding CsgD family transcriptional regulator